MLSEQLPLLTTAPDGIQKLRDLILELAVRGKLVPQNPNDEPTSALLERIAQERARLEAEGICKKPKLSLPVGEDEEPFTVPRGWEWVRLATLGNTQTGTTPIKTHAHLFGSDYPFIKPGDISPAGINYENEGLSAEGAIASGRLASAQSILMVCIGTIGKCGLIDRTCSFNQQINSVSPVAETSPFAFLVLRSPYFQAEAWDRSSSTTIAILNKGNWETIPIPLPPLSEQHRIVAKVDELMALCDRLETEQANAESAQAKLVETLLGTLTQSTDAADFAANWQRVAEHFDTLFTTESSLDALKQTILQLAVMGKLVPQEPDDEPTKKLLKRIEQELIAKGGPYKKSKLLPVVTDHERRFELPAAWDWVRFGSIADTRLGKMLDAAKNQGQLKPYLRNTNVQWWRFELDDIKEMRLAEDELQDFRLAQGDLLICEGGEPGRCAIWRSELDEIYFQKALHRARPLGGCISEYLQIVLRQDAVSGFLNSYFTGATIKHFTGEKLNRYVLPLPPVAEQCRIVTKVNELTALCDRLKAELSESRYRQERLASTLIESALKAA